MLIYLLFLVFYTWMHILGKNLPLLLLNGHIKQQQQKKNLKVKIT